MHSQAPGELGLTAIAFIASARARANWLFLRSSLQLRIGSLMRTTVATRCAMESANATAVPGLPFVTVKLPDMPELEMSIKCTSAMSALPFFP